MAGLEVRSSDCKSLAILTPALPHSRAGPLTLRVWGRKDPWPFRREPTSQTPKMNPTVNSTSLSLADQRRLSSGKTNPGSWELLLCECEILTKSVHLGRFVGLPR